MRTTLAAALVPGLGHLLLGRRLAAGLLAGAAALAVGLPLAHVLQGIPFFDTSLGSFLLGTLLRNAAVLHAFSVIDAYLSALEPAGEHHPPRRRLAVILNVLLPGLGYGYIRAWIRTLTGLVLVAVFVYFAMKGHHPYLDLIFLGMQVIMAVAVYRQVRIQEQAGPGGKDMMAAAEAVERRRPMGPLPVHDQGAQVVALVIGVMALVWVGLVVQLRMLPAQVTGLSVDHITAEPTPRGINFKVSSLGLSMSAMGKGWAASDHQPGSLFQAVHEGKAMLKVGIQLVPAFMEQERFMARLRRMGEGQRYQFNRIEPLEINGLAARQLSFARQYSGGKLQLSIVAIPRGRFAYVMFFECQEPSCAALRPQLDASRDSFTLSN